MPKFDYWEALTFLNFSLEALLVLANLLTYFSVGSDICNTTLALLVSNTLVNVFLIFHFILSFTFNFLISNRR